MPQEIPELTDYLNRCCANEHIEPFFLKIEQNFYLLVEGVTENRYPIPDDPALKLIIN